MPATQPVTGMPANLRGSGKPATPPSNKGPKKPKL